MIQINPLQSYIDGGARAAITSPPSASLVFDLPGKAIWVKGVKLKGIDHTYTFSHDNYITLTNTPDRNNPESEDIKIGVNITALKNVIDTTYNGGTLALLQEGLNTDERTWLAKILHNYINSVLPITKSIKINGVNYAIYTTEDTLPQFFAPGSLGTIGQILSCTSTGLSWVNLIQNTDYRVSLSTATNNNDYRIILKQEPDNNPETSFVRFSEYLTFNPSTKILKVNNAKVITAADVYIGATSDTNATAGLVPAATSAQRNYFLRGDGTWANMLTATWRPIKVDGSEKLGNGADTGAIDFVAGTGITLGWDATNSKIIITNSASDLDHNTDRTGIKLGTISGTLKTDSTLIINNSVAGLTIAGGTNKFSIGDGTNYIEIPINPSFTITNKAANILTTATTLATINGSDITAKVEVEDKAVTLTTTSKTIATIAGVDITAKITNYNTDENVRQIDNNDDELRPILTKNGTGTGTITSSTTFADGVKINMKYNYIQATSYYTTSDRLKKRNISSFSEHIYKFQMRNTEKWYYGVIAQEVPEMFREGKEGNMTVNYNSVLSYYIGLLELKVLKLEDKLKKYEEMLIKKD